VCSCLQHGDGNAPRCDPANPTSCLTYVYVLESGQMVRSRWVLWERARSCA